MPESLDEVVDYRPEHFLKETPAQVFCCEFLETFESTIITEHLRATASDAQNTTCSI